MKLSEQRWTIEEVQQLANLRVLNKSNPQWGKLEKVIKLAAYKLLYTYCLEPGLPHQNFNKLSR